MTSWSTIIIGQLILILFAHQNNAGVEAAICSHCLYGEGYCNPNTRECLYGCVSGWLGPMCARTCTIDHCIECNLNSSGFEQCKRCDPGFHGALCNGTCSYNCIGTHRDACDSQGHCLFGCESGWEGDSCDQVYCPYDHCKTCQRTISNMNFCKNCDTGYYWEWNALACEGCSRNCLGGVQACDTEHGHCLNGCQPGYYGSGCNDLCTLQHCANCSSKSPPGSQMCAMCELGFYPDLSSKVCVSCEKNCIGYCNQSTGHCKQCRDGWFGDRCEHFCKIEHCVNCKRLSNGAQVCLNCSMGFYIDDHQCETCPVHCGGSQAACNKTSGHCLEGCQPGYYGDQCQYMCSSHCVSQVCDVKGLCDCEEGWYNQRCNRPCPVNCAYCDDFVNGVCQECSAGYYGNQCENRCGDMCAHSLQTGYVYCHKNTGYCVDGCRPGFFGDFCNQTCSTTCDSGVCDRRSGDCSIGCSYRYYGKDCSGRCSDNCKDLYTITARPCDMGNGICLHGCKENHFYGYYCNHTCNERCVGNTCDQFSGKCLAGCKSGYYGDQCDKPCSKNCKGLSCDWSTGRCELGCQIGYYGRACLTPCVGNCIGNQCDQDTGKCTQDCPPGLYGLDCKLTCTGGCRNQTCRRDTGMCSGGCVAGKRGDFCSDDCSPGWYGESCSQVCGRCLNHDPCSITDGTCHTGCAIGFQGDLCSQAMSTSDEAANNHLEIAIPAGVSVAAVIVLGFLIGGLFYWWRRLRFKKLQKSPEPTVIYSHSHTNSMEGDAVPSIHIQPGTSGVQSDRDREPVPVQRDSSDVSIHATDSQLLGYSDSSSPALKLGNVIKETDYCDLHAGRMCLHGINTGVIVKVVARGDPGRSEKLKRLKNEAEILQLTGNHRNIVNVLKVQQDTDLYCLAVEDCATDDLLSYLHSLEYRQSDMEPVYRHQLMQFAMDVTCGICYLHSKQVMHRSLRARSVYLTENFVAKIGDFQWAKVISDRNQAIHRHHTEASVAVEWCLFQEDLPRGSLEWLAPEALTYGLFSTKSDIWSLGMVLWQIFTYGEMPYKDLDVEALKSAWTNGSLPPKPPLVHFTLYRIMKSCWRYSPEDRLSADVVSQQLSDVQTRYHAEYKGIVTTV